MSSFRWLIKIVFFVFFIAGMNANACAKDTLVFALDLVRHGDRIPLANIPYEEHKWPEEQLGELTPKGMQQEYKLGLSLRHRYQHFLPEKYVSQVMYVKSTDFNRTLDSAQAILLGMYPLGSGPKLVDGSSALPSGYQPIPIHTVSQDQDKLLLGCNQNQFDALAKKYVFNTKKWKEKSFQYQDKIKYWSKITGLDLSDLSTPKLRSFADNLYIRKLHNIPMPQGITKDDEQQIFDLLHWIFTTVYNDDQVAHYASDELLKDVKQRLLAVVKGESKVKYVLYVGHETTLMPFLSALGDKLTKIPHYSSDVNLQLVQSDDNKYYVRLYLNEELVSLPKCGTSSCPLDKFIALLGT